MIEKLNISLNLICFVLILFGGMLAFYCPDVGKLVVTAAFGALGGSAVRKSSTLNQ